MGYLYCNNPIYQRRNVNVQIPGNIGWTHAGGSDIGIRLHVGDIFLHISYFVLLYVLLIRDGIVVCT